VRLVGYLKRNLLRCAVTGMYSYYGGNIWGNKRGRTCNTHCKVIE